jgi:epoxyqueuosine reductase
VAARHRRPTRPADADYAEELRRLGLDAGLDAVGIAVASPWLDARQRLEERRAAGLHGGMSFTYRDPARSADPTRALPDAAAVVVGARSYRRVPPSPPPRAAGPTGRVGAYAWIEHYQPLREALKAVAAQLKADGWRARVLVDDNALMDREAAHRAGLGWFGKNANLLLPGHGSWFVLGGVVTSAPLPTASPDDRVPDGCGTCRRCLDGCPTGAIVAPGVVDARRCLSWLLQVPGDFPRAYREALGDHLYGCDDCQEVCPPNRRADAAMPPPPAEPDAVADVALLELLAAGDAELLDRHGAWYLPDRSADHLRRNALVVLGNSGHRDDPRVISSLAAYLDHPNPVLRSHAAWAARRLGRPDLLDGRAHDPAVAAELGQPAPHRARRIPVAAAP